MFNTLNTGHLYLRLKMLPLQSVILMTVISVTASDRELEGPAGEEFEDNPLLGEQTGDSFDSQSECSTDLKDASVCCLTSRSVN